MVARLRSLGIPITEELVAAKASGATAVGRPHVADVLVDLGVVGSRDQAFADYLGTGGRGYVSRPAAPLPEAIRAVAGGGTYIDPSLAGGVVEDFVHPVPPRENDSPDLSERESEVVRLIAQGYSNKEIAARLKLSVKTVETYKSRSMEKLGARSRVDIVRYASRRGWLANA